MAESRRGACSLRILKCVILLLLFSCSVLTDSLQPHGLTPWTAARQASLSFTISRSLLRLTSIELVMLSYHLIFCCPLLLLPSIFPSIISLKNKIVPCLWKGNIFRRMSEYALQVQHFFFNIKSCIREVNVKGNCFRKHDVISDFPSPGHRFLLNSQHPAFGPAPLCLYRSQSQCARNWTGRMRGWCGGSCCTLSISDKVNLQKVCIPHPVTTEEVMDGAVVLSCKDTASGYSAASELEGILCNMKTILTILLFTSLLLLCYS